MCSGGSVTSTIELIPKVAGRFSTVPARFSYEVDGVVRVRTYRGTALCARDFPCSARRLGDFALWVLSSPYAVLCACSQPLCACLLLAPPPLPPHFDSTA